MSLAAAGVTPGIGSEDATATRKRPRSPSPPPSCGSSLAKAVPLLDVVQAAVGSAGNAKRDGEQVQQGMELLASAGIGSFGDLLQQLSSSSGLPNSLPFGFRYALRDFVADLQRKERPAAEKLVEQVEPPSEIQPEALPVHLPLPPPTAGRQRRDYEGQVLSPNLIDCHEVSRRLQQTITEWQQYEHISHYKQRKLRYKYWNQIRHVVELKALHAVALYLVGHKSKFVQQRTQGQATKERRSKQLGPNAAASWRKTSGDWSQSNGGFGYAHAT